MSKVHHPELGKCLTTKNVISKTGRIMWCVREEGARKTDNGWRFFSEYDTEEYLVNANNWVVIDFDEIVKIEPALLSLMWMPYGTELTIDYRENETVFFDDRTGKPAINPMDGSSMIKKCIRKNDR